MMAKTKGRGGSHQRVQHKRGLWTVEEDKILMDYVTAHGKGRWNVIAKRTGLKRCGKSCRLRWMNYLRPDVKRDGFTEQEEDLIIRLHKLLGNRWSLIARRIPGRSDNQVKNHWNTHLSKKLVGAKTVPTNSSEESEGSSSVDSISEQTNGNAHEIIEKPKAVAVETQENSQSCNNEIQADDQPQVMGGNSCGMSSPWDFDNVMTTWFHEYSIDDLSWLRP